MPVACADKTRVDLQVLAGPAVLLCAAPFACRGGHVMPGEDIDRMLLWTAGSISADPSIRLLQTKGLAELSIELSTALT
jgi:hypothetical protein